MVNQLGKFTPNLSTLSKPLRELMSTKKIVVLGPTTAGFIQVSEAGADKTDSPCTVQPEYSHQDLSQCLSIWARSSTLQEAESARRPVIYASCSLSETERRYTQIEKEALAVT